MDIHVRNSFRADTMDSHGSANRYVLSDEQIKEYFPGVAFTNIQRDEVPICNEIAPETVCFVVLYEQDVDGDGDKEPTNNGLLTVRGVAPGQAFNLTKIANWFAAENGITLTRTQREDVEIQLNQRFFSPYRNLEGEAFSKSGKHAELTIQIHEGNFVLQNPYGLPEGEMGISATRLEELLRVGIDIVDEEEYSRYLEKVENAESRREFFDKFGIPLVVLMTGSAGWYLISKFNQYKRKLRDSMKETGYRPGSIEDKIYREIQSQLRESQSIVSRPPRWVIASIIRDHHLSKSSDGIDIRIAVSHGVKDYGLFKKNKNLPK